MNIKTLLTLTFAIALGCNIANSVSAAIINLIPSEDNSQIFGTTETAEGTSFEAMARHQQAIAAIVARDPNVLDFMSSIGAGGCLGTSRPGWGWLSTGSANASWIGPRARGSVPSC